MTVIRSFSNADLPTVLDLWSQHWSTLGPPPEVSAAKFEQAVLARTYFDPATLLLAETGDGVVGWSHFAGCPTHEQTAVLCSLCLAPTCPAETGDQLLAETIDRIQQRGFQRIEAGVVRDERFGYAGLDPIGHGNAIPMADTRLTSVLQQQGFQPERRVTRMTASTTAYRPKVSREALQLRRSTKIESESIRQFDRRNAASMSHLDVEAHRLIGSGNEELACVQTWASDPEAEIMRPSLVILDLSPLQQTSQLDAAESYLIGALIQALAQHHVDTVETVVDSDEAGLIEQLQALQFQPAEEGVLWAKSL